MVKKLKEVAGDAVSYLAMGILVVMVLVEDGYNRLRYGRPAQNSWHDLD